MPRFGELPQQKQRIILHRQYREGEEYSKLLFANQLRNLTRIKSKLSSTDKSPFIKI